MITAIIQARLGSKRFPNKVFAQLSGKPLIWHVVNRLRWSKKLDQIVLATTTNRADDALVLWADDNKVVVFRGSEEDVLSRFHDAANRFPASKIVRITADDPFKDPEIMDAVIELLEIKELDFAYNNKPPSFPEGIDIEVFTIAALKQAHLESHDPFEREHMTQYFYRHPEIFKQMNYSYKENISNLRWTIDTMEDFTLATEVYNHLYVEGRIFLTDDILELLKKKPHIMNINRQVERSAMYKK